MGPMGELGALFNPGMRHEIEERESKQNRREEEGNARDGDLRIDLASGVAVINIPGGKAASGEEQDGDQDVKAAARTSRTVGEKPSSTTSSSTRRSAHSRAEERKAAAARNGRSTDHPASDRADRSKSGSDKSETPRPAPAPSSKASRAAR